MATITVKINERSNFGKTILELIKIGVKEKKGVEVVATPNKATIEAIENAKKGNTEKVSLAQFRKQLY